MYICRWYGRMSDSWSHGICLCESIKHVTEQYKYKYPIQALTITSRQDMQYMNRSIPSDDDVFACRGCGANTDFAETRTLGRSKRRHRSGSEDEIFCESGCVNRSAFRASPFLYEASD